MRPLKPDDLLIRKTPVEQHRWAETADRSGQKRPLQLERHQELEQTLRNNPVQSEPYIELARIFCTRSDGWMRSACSIGLLISLRMMKK